MRRIFCGFLASMAALLCPLAGCSKKTKNESRINSDFETVTKEDIVGITTEEIYVPEQKPYLSRRTIISLIIFPSLKAAKTGNNFL